MNKKELKKLIEEISRTAPKGYSTGGSGLKTIAAVGTPERISDQDKPIAQIMITAERTNTGYIYIGFDKMVSAANYGKELVARDLVVIPIDNLNKIWMDVSVNGDGVSYIWLV